MIIKVYFSFVVKLADILSKNISTFTGNPKKQQSKLKIKKGAEKKECNIKTEKLKSMGRLKYVTIYLSFM